MNWRNIEQDYPSLLRTALRELDAEDFYPAGGLIAAGRETYAITADGVIPVFNPRPETADQPWRHATTLAPEGALALLQYCEDLDDAIIYDELPVPVPPYDDCYGPMKDGCEPDPASVPIRKGG